MKKIHSSKTIWSNILLFALLFVPELNHDFFRSVGLNEKTTIVVVAYLTKILVVLNILLRFNTNKKLEYPKWKR